MQNAQDEEELTQILNHVESEINALFQINSSICNNTACFQKLRDSLKLMIERADNIRTRCASVIESENSQNEVSFSDCFSAAAQQMADIVSNYAALRACDPIVSRNLPEIRDTFNKITELTERIMLTRTPRLRVLEPASLPESKPITSFVHVSGSIESEGALQQLKDFDSKLIELQQSLVNSMSSFSANMDKSSVLRQYPEFKILMEFPFFQTWLSIQNKLMDGLKAAESTISKSSHEIHLILKSLNNVIRTLQNRIEVTLENIRTLFDTQQQYTEAKMHQKKLLLIRYVRSEYRFFEEGPMYEDRIQTFFETEAKTLNSFQSDMPHALEIIRSTLPAYRNILDFLSTKNAFLKERSSAKDKLILRFENPEDEEYKLPDSSPSDSLLLQRERSQECYEQFTSKFEKAQSIVVNLLQTPLMITEWPGLEHEKVQKVAEKTVERLLTHATSEWSAQVIGAMQEQIAEHDMELKSLKEKTEHARRRKEICLTKCGHCFLEEDIAGVSACPICQASFEPEDVVKINWN